MSFFEKVGLGRSRSAKSAKERLQLVLVHDRAGISPGKLEVLKDDLIDVISRHLEINSALWPIFHSPPRACDEETSAERCKHPVSGVTLTSGFLPRSH
jgi:cell division topological specificity factor MinE